jgi:LPS-assembly lipoprotein
MRNLQMRAILLSLALVLLAGCGFQLRGAYSLPYESLYLSMPEYSDLGAGLKRAIRASGSTRLADTESDAQARFIPSTDLREKVILSLSGTGRVRELRLRWRYGYRIVDSKGLNLVAPVEIELTRDLTYDDSNVLAKEQEEALLWRDMQGDMVQQVMRRLSAAKLIPAALAE